MYSSVMDRLKVRAIKTGGKCLAWRLISSCFLYAEQIWNKMTSSKEEFSPNSLLFADRTFLCKRPFFHKNIIIFWVLIVLLPLAAIRLCLLYAFPQWASNGAYFSSEIPFSSCLDSKIGQSVDYYQNVSNCRTGECDISKGEWVYESTGSTYTNSTCWYIQDHQNCMRNGRPDTTYLHWRWKPADCELPRFNASSFFDKMKGKTVAFVGDSIARNHMQSLLCALSQVEVPRREYSDEKDRFVRWSFPSYSFKLSTFWSPYLVQQTEEQFKEIPKGVSKLFLDALDTSWLANLTQFDVIILSSGQWYLKSNIYYMKNKPVGCHYCDRKNVTEVGFYAAYKTVIRQVLSYLKSAPEFKGLTVLRTFSPDHFENGRWDNGGSCQRTVPFSDQTVQLTGLNSKMHKIQLEEYRRIKKKETTNGSKVRLLDVTRLSYLRPDGHPGAYRESYPFAPNGSATLQHDCLHWCIPGPVDSWNDILLEMLKQEV